MSSTAEHRAPIASEAAYYGPAVHAASRTARRGEEGVKMTIAALQTPGGDGAPQADGTGRRAARISTKQLHREVNAAHQKLPNTDYHRVLFAWETGTNPYTGRRD